MQSTLIIFVLLILGSLNSYAGGHDHSAMNHSEKASKKSKPSMAEMFGPDYKKGDIGHSTGIIKSITVAGSLIIEHAKMHGTKIDAQTTEFEVLDSADISELAESNRVEFVTKRGKDDVYRVFKICKLSAGKRKCLKK